MRKLFYLAALAVVISAPVAASTKDLDAAVMKATRYGIEQMPASDRYVLATAALAYWRSFDARIPRNSPATREWLSGEMATDDLDRIGRVIRTPEYALMQLEQQSTLCVENLERLSKIVGGGSLAEMYAWVKVLGCYGNISGTVQYLAAAHLSNGKYDGPFSIQHASLFHGTVTGAVANSIAAESTP